MKKKVFYMLAIPIFMLIIWSILSYFNLVSNLILPSPVSVFYSLVNLILGGILINDLYATLQRVIFSFLIALIVGIPLGLLMGYFDKVYDSLEFIVDFFRSLPATALFPLFILFFGVGNLSKIIVAAWSATLIMVINSMYGVRLTKKTIINAAKSMKIKGYMLFRKILLPGAMPQIFAGMRISISLILTIVVITEMFIGTNAGLGYRIIEAQSIYNTPVVYASILIVGIAGFLINKAFISLEKKIVHWKGE